MNSVFVLGILQRSGTNFLYNLLKLHPDVKVPETIYEDYFLFHSHKLLGYVQSVNRQWRERWGVRPDDKNELTAEFGNAILRFLNHRAGSGRVLVSKTPRVKNIDLFSRLFPTGRLLIIVRDGRSVVESGMRSFDWDFETASRKWADGARTIKRFDEQNLDRYENYRIVRYEDLFQETGTVMSDILSFVGLSADHYDFDRANNLSVYGSSTYRGGEERMHWEPIERATEFNPLDRWKDWSPDRHRRFNWIAGDELVKLGYSPVDAGGGGLPQRLVNRSLDAVWAAQQSRRLMREFEDITSRIRSIGSRARNLIGI
ncbi:MAG: sulfotransferase [Gemmatimonadota bacterium]|nr:sulfotransferase [Gemmatimonadota bacterium]